MRLVLADASVTTLEQIEGVLTRAGHEVIGKAYDANTMEALIRMLGHANQLPDVLITDVQMPPEMQEDGLKVALKLRQSFPQMGIMFLSDYGPPQHAQKIFGVDPLTGRTPADDPGGIGYLKKETVSRVIEFLRALLNVSAGRVVVNKEMATMLTQMKRQQYKRLKDDEVDTLNLIARGLTNEQIARKRVLPDQEVKDNISRVLSKLKIKPKNDSDRARAVLKFLAP